MKLTKENGDNRQVVLTIEIPEEEWSKAIEAAVKRIANQVNIRGFRRGKAPRRIVEREVGLQAILDEAYEKMGPKAFNEAMEQEKLELATYPQFERVTVEEGKPLIFKATVTPKPEVTLGEYKGLKVEKAAEEVTEAQVDEHINKMRERQAKLVDAPEGAAVAKGDLVTLDFKGFVDGEAFEGGEGKDYPLQIGSGSFIPGFEDQLVGAKAGETREVKVTFPADYHEKKLAGKDAVFQCTVHTIRHKELPALDDEALPADVLQALALQTGADVPAMAAGVGVADGAGTPAVEGALDGAGAPEGEAASNGADAPAMEGTSDDAGAPDDAGVPEVESAPDGAGAPAVEAASDGASAPEAEAASGGDAAPAGEAVPEKGADGEDAVAAGAPADAHDIQPAATSADNTL